MLRLTYDIHIVMGASSGKSDEEEKKMKGTDSSLSLAIFFLEPFSKHN